MSVWVRDSGYRLSRVDLDGFESGDTTAWSASGSRSGLANVTTTQSYTYDRFGNLLTVDTDGVVASYATDELTNRMSAASYDASGNVTSYLDGDGVTVSLVYDALNRLIQRDRSGSPESWRFLYTADDERMAVIETSSNDYRWTLRDLGGMVLREFDYAPGGTATQTRDQVYRGGSLLATTLGTATVEHYSLDHLGSPRVVTDASGGMVSRHKYYPYGEEATLTGQDSHPMKFTGHERDFFEGSEGDDLDYMHARYCDPMGGRFLSVDRAKAKPRAPQSWNQYAYVSNNPLNFVDPDGLVRVRAYSTTIGVVYEVGFETRAFVATEAARGIAGYFNPTGVSEYADFLKNLDAAAKGEFLEYPEVGTRGKWKNAEFEGRVLRVFEERLDGKGVGGWPRTTGGYGLYDQEGIKLVRKAFNTVISEMLRAGEISQSEARKRRAAYNKLFRELLGEEEEDDQED